MTSLPSIHEMFPEHMLRDPPNWRHRPAPPTLTPTPPPPIPTRAPPTRCAYTILRSSPASTSLIPYPHPKSKFLSTEADDEDKKHVCTVCKKRFNRPSSLRIHINTHTGATPFQCPFPGCGRGFNVNSNMRRHYRNHTTSSPAAAPPQHPSPSSSSSSSSYSYPAQKRRILSKSEYERRPPSSSSTDDEEDEEDEEERAKYRLHRARQEKEYEERDYDRRRMSTAREEYDHRATARYSYARSR